jgi:hypothetical protein
MSKPWEIGEGAVSLDCPTAKRWGYKGKKVCRCGTCAHCGHVLHSSVHMHAYGGKPGDKPFDHRFVPKESKP